MSVYISYSLINDYINCSNRAYYRIFRKDLAVPNKFMVIGNIVHRSLEKYWNNEEKAIKYIYEQEQDGRLSTKDYSAMEHHIHVFFERFNKFLTKNDSIEKNFKIKLYDDVYLVGKFDRISKGIVYDWKTSSTVPSSLSNDIQFIIYQNAYEMLYNRPPDACFLASLSEGSLIPYKHNQEYSSEVFDRIVPDIIKDIKDKNFRKEGIFKKGTCHYCSYKEDCLKNNQNVMVSGNFIEK